MTLFDQNVAYWETPYRKLQDLQSVRREWQAIDTQQDISLNLRLYSSDGDKHTVAWNLSYRDTSGTLQNWAGLYTVELHNDKCVYFYQVGERQPGPA